MHHRSRVLFPAACLATALLLSSCGDDAAAPAASADVAQSSDAAAAIPASLAPFGDGYPDAGDPCRRLGESDATREWLDDSADLIGCPSTAAAAALGGRTVATVDGITIVSVPSGGRDAMAATADGGGDALVPGTDFNATAMIPCSADGGEPRGQCNAGVRRGTGPDGTTTVVVTKADGQTRAIFFRGTEAFSADGAQADGSAAYDFSARRVGDESQISFGPERYVIPDAFVEGG